VAFINRARHYLGEDYLPKIQRCLDRLTDEQIWWRPNPDSNSIGNLVLHICGNARQWIVCGVGGAADHRIRDQEFGQREIVGREKLSELLTTTTNEVDLVLTSLNSELLLEVRTIQGKDVDVLEAVFHVAEHFSMHTGQIITLTKILSETDLSFYQFKGGVPVEHWK
jgi:uncharacterized damage-inducible protein DinB